MLHYFLLLKDSISMKNKMFLNFFETAAQLDVSYLTTPLAQVG
jgi:hypothetical protein